MYTGIRLLLLICPFISSFFFLSHFQTLKFFVTISSGPVRPRRVKLGTHMDSGQMYRVYRNQLLLLIRLHLSFSQFSNIKIFRHTFLRNCEAYLEGWNVVHTRSVGRCIVYTGIRLFCCLFVPLFLHFSFSPVFKHLNFSWQFCSKTARHKNLK